MKGWRKLRSIKLKKDGKKMAKRVVKDLGMKLCKQSFETKRGCYCGIAKLTIGNETLKKLEW